MTLQRLANALLPMSVRSLPGQPSMCLNSRTIVLSLLPLHTIDAQVALVAMPRTIGGKREQGVGDKPQEFRC